MQTYLNIQLEENLVIVNYVEIKANFNNKIQIYQHQKKYNLVNSRESKENLVLEMKFKLIFLVKSVKLIVKMEDELDKMIDQFQYLSNICKDPPNLIVFIKKLVRKIIEKAVNVVNVGYVIHFK